MALDTKFLVFGIIHTFNGAISTSFKDKLSINDNILKGSVRVAQNVTVKLESRNGNIKVDK
ncbi:hypothetical protein IC218_13400 [Clostridioides sp. ES-S-0005-03]|uniref:hypothetical protein n=1 Tax=unclassified Clostridioides TaxID=2635829 RepID=UPI001D11DCE0|nr:hypothetical protein [Clostridioides sp. ES-S-0005-03]MCC0704046.1 hypothetical protein [Clostridioides sp. ES-S-0049-02]UDN48149.1 hypothetical protein JJJ25_03535 [Clostridioides sp. ES-S-0173-01]UDN57867.1 hypothetical protein JJC01_17135 [Clostridioides sp. ES-S-0010-02]